MKNLLSAIIFLISSSSQAGLGFIPIGPAPKPFTKQIEEGRSLEVIYFTPQDPQETAMGSVTDSRVFSQETFRGLESYIQNLGNLSYILSTNRNNPNFHWIDMGGGAGHAQVESHFSLPLSLFPDYQYDRRKREEDRPEMLKLDFFHSPDGTYRYAPLFSVPTGTLYSEETLKSADPCCRFKTTNISFTDIVTPYLEGRLIGDEENSIRSRNIFQPWREKLIKQGTHKEIFGKLAKDIPDEHLEKADLITDFFGPLTYAPNKFYYLMLYAKKLKKGGQLIFKTSGHQAVRGLSLSDSRPNRSSAFDKFDMDFIQFLQEVKLPGFKAYTNGISHTLTVTDGTIEILSDLSQRVARAQVGSSKTYYDAPPGTIMWLEGVKINSKVHYSYKQEPNVIIESQKTFLCGTFYKGI